VTLRTALTWSANAATVRVSRAVGERRVAAQAHRNGIESDLQAVPAIALGAVEVTPIELVTAYAPFANGGVRVHPHVVRKISRDDGTVLWRGSTQINEQVMDARDAFQVTSMLRSVVDEGTGRGVRSAGAYGPIAGKTGTTNNGSDVWFVGYTPTLLAGFWFGYDTPRSLGNAASGGRYAAVAWGDFYREGWRERSPAWEPPNGLIAVDIDRQTGKRASEWCGDGRAEWFKAGTEPTDECDSGNFHFDVNEIVDQLIDRLDERELRRLTRAFRDIVGR
jgi:penicillin-binding protein 1A